MKNVFHLLFISFCFWVVGSVMSGGLAHAHPPGGPFGQAGLNATLNEVLERLDTVSCAASGFIDNLDGTLCDCTRNLMWENKTGTVGDFVLCDSAAAYPDPNDVNNRYTWSSSGTDPDGTVYTVFLAQLNDVAGGGADCFAGHCDWRLPEAGDDADVKELETIVDLGKGFCGDLVGACINPIFGPTWHGGYWSSTTDASMPLVAWRVRFDVGSAENTSLKQNYNFARAVRPCM